MVSSWIDAARTGIGRVRVAPVRPSRLSLMLITTPVRLRSLLLLLTALGLLPIALVGGWGIRATIDQQEQQSRAAVLAISRALASAVDAELESTISSLRSLSYNSTLVYGDLLGFYNVAQEVTRERADWRSIVLTDNLGRLLFKTNAPFGSTESRIVDPESVAQVIASREPVVGSIVKKVNGPAAFAIRIPVIDNGNLTYTLSVAVKPDRIVDILKRQNVPVDWVIAVHDATLHRVARSRDHEKTVGANITPSLNTLLAEGNQEGVGISRTVEGVEVITAFTRTSHHRWTVAVGAPTAYFEQQMLQHFTVYGAAIAASLLICFSLAVLIARRIAGSIDGLERQAVRLVQGDPVDVMPSVIQEVNQMGAALQAASTERIAVEQERERLLESLNAALGAAQEAGMAKDNFLAILGHELRNPLAPMVAALDLLDARGETAGLREREIMRRQVGHMKRLVDDLLDVSRITRGKLQMRREPVALADVIQQATDAVQPMMSHKGRRLLVDVPGNVWVLGDEARLVQVVTNLLNNAMHFDPQGPISLMVRKEPEHACIVVRDRGAGMSAETVDRIFTPFYQAPQSLARQSGGLGLGLAIVKSIVDLHGGTVEARSDGPGKGSEMTVRLPVIAPPQLQTKAPPPVADARRKRIIIVDDNVDAADMLAEVFRLDGHEVDVSHDGNSALRQMASATPDVAILDIGLPDIDGFELARTVRARHDPSAVKLIALSGYGQEGDKARAAEAGFDLHLTKPVDMDELRQALA
ncbi:hybrid sensor histidine kinase/response regulator [Noviherbaspirillum galbum]|uniref:histidine kinase n=1 Tax=Noviherbaspirillum galbum TaxID=2709383 RepID=A0A6B3SRP3_9BURK|nr:ATP-binding protein [Noviherbaspirillum galbum]NEX60319.1 response regulator [Noviherbaspirillum galbum]